MQSRQAGLVFSSANGRDCTRAISAVRCRRNCLRLPQSQPTVKLGLSPTKSNPHGKTKLYAKRSRLNKKQLLETEKLSKNRIKKRLYRDCEETSRDTAAFCRDTTLLNRQVYPIKAVNLNVFSARLTAPYCARNQFTASAVPREYFLGKRLDNALASKSSQHSR